MILFFIWLLPALTFSLIVIAGFKDKAFARYVGTDRRPWLVFLVGITPIINVLFYLKMLHELRK